MFTSFLLAVTDPTLLGAAAMLTAVTGAWTTYRGIQITRHEERLKNEQDCERKLKDARIEAEDCMDELHKLRMKYPGNR